MSCKKPWSDEFLIENTNKTFCHKELKEHRKKIILEKELSKMPETMPFVEQEIEIRKFQKEILSTEELLKEAQKEVSRLSLQKAGYQVRINSIRNGEQPESSDQRKKFIMCCRNGDCRGFLSTQYKCEICEVYTCPDCLEVIGKDKNQPHTCNPDNVASAEFIKKDTKPCPKCGTRIHKIAGCSQMWCTQCQVAFDYNTLKIDSGPIHNPEYFKYIRENTNNTPRNPQDVVCGGLIQFQPFNIVIGRTVEKALNISKELNKHQIESIINKYGFMEKHLYKIYEQISHISFHQVPILRRKVTELQDNKKERVAYMIGEMTKDDLSTIVYSKEKKQKKERELLHVYELLNTVGIETINSLYQDSNLFKINYLDIGKKKMIEKLSNQVSANTEINDYLEIIKEKITILDNLRIYCNERFSKISKTYNHNIYLLDENWIPKNSKAKTKAKAKDNH
tara:strand:+ start:9954 stop:11306 length:1353 start_codon:yes stop_codon:yes gene_type:complete